MNHQDPIPWLRVICMLATLVMFAYYRSESSPLATSTGPETDSRLARKPRFLWGDWNLRDDDRIELHFRVEGAMIWWLTVELVDGQLKDATVMPKNFLPGESGHIEMRYPGLLDAHEEETLEFGIRYCTPKGTIETQFFKWALWRDASPLSTGAAIVA